MNKSYYHRSSQSRTAVGIRKLAFLLSIAVLATACRDSTGPTGASLKVCHMEGSTGTITDIFASELAGHKKHGDYVTQLEVDKLNTPGDSIHFTRITDALAVARGVRLAHSEGTKAACRITIAVAPGSLRGSTAASADSTMERFPLVIDVPDITLKGALKMQVDADGRATGIGDAGDATTFSPVPALIVTGASSQTGVSEEIIIVNAHPSMGATATVWAFPAMTAFSAADASPLGTPPAV